MTNEQHFRNPGLETMEISHRTFCDTYKDAVHDQMNRFLASLGKRRKHVSSRYWTEKNSDPWRHWETLHFIELVYKRPKANFV